MSSMPDETSDSSPQQPPVGRRTFFRRLALFGLDRAEQSGRRALSRVQRIVGVSHGASESAGDARDTRIDHEHRLLRPPGALPEDEFVDTCSRCGKCVDACPADAIELEPSMAGGFPYIIARYAPCVICNDLSCMKVCPSGALQLVDDAADIHMGTALVNQQQCLRTGADGHAMSGKAEDCRICVIQCPVGEDAIGVGDDLKIDVREGCTGCGVCERVCPTEPASVVVMPARKVAGDARVPNDDLSASGPSLRPG